MLCIIKSQLFDSLLASCCNILVWRSDACTVLCATALLGNVLVIAVILLHRKMRNVVNFCLANLAVADLCVGVFCVLPNLSLYISQSWHVGRVRICRIFYRAMYFSAKRGIAIACRLSVCLSVRPSVRPSVTLVNCDHIGWNSSKIISPLVSLGRSLFATPTRRVCSKGNTPKFLPE